MRHVRIFIVLTLMLCLSGTAGMVFAEDVIKVGACQPITGRFAFAGKHLNAGLMDSLNYSCSSSNCLIFSLNSSRV